MATTSTGKPFPAFAYIQRFDEVPPDYLAVAKELERRGIQYVLKRTEDFVVRREPWNLTKNDLVVGQFDWTRLAAEKLRVALPQPPDYPDCLKHMLHRRIWESTLGDVQAFLRTPEAADMSVFIKPAAGAKEFSAIVEPRDQMLDFLITGMEDVMPALPRTTAVHCSEVVEMVAEWRVFVVNGAVHAVCQYREPSATALAETSCVLDMNVVNEAVRLLTESGAYKDVVAGCGIDFATMRRNGGAWVTGLVEVNDGFSLGRYEGLSDADYTDLLIARWAALVKP